MQTTAQSIDLSILFYDKAALGRKEKEAEKKRMEAIQEQFNALPKETAEKALEIATKPPEHFQLITEFNDLSIEQLKNILDAIKDNAKNITQLSRFEEIKARYTPFTELHGTEKLTVDNIQNHLESQLKNELAFFGAKENNIYLDELRKIEPLAEKMYQKLKREHYKDETSLLMRDIVPKKTEKVTKQLESFKPTEKTTYKEYSKINSIKSHRKKSSNNLPVPEAA